MRIYGKTCTGCIYDGMPKCPIMKSKPKERFCHRTKEEADRIRIETERDVAKGRK